MVSMNRKIYVLQLMVKTTGRSVGKLYLTVTYLKHCVDCSWMRNQQPKIKIIELKIRYCLAVRICFTSKALRKSGVMIWSIDKLRYDWFWRSDKKRELLRKDQGQLIDNVERAIIVCVEKQNQWIYRLLCTCIHASKIENAMNFLTRMKIAAIAPLKFESGTCWNLFLKKSFNNLSFWKAQQFLGKLYF